MKSAEKTSQEKCSIFLTRDSLININGLSEDHLHEIVSMVRLAVSGYDQVKDLGFAQQKEAFNKFIPELQKLSNSERRLFIEEQLKRGKAASEVLYAIEGWKKENEGTKKVE